jgi:hypothetical protein
VNAVTEIKHEASALSAAPEAPATRALSVIEHAVRSGATPDQLERLLDLQVRADNHQLELMRERRRMDEEDRKAAALLAFRRDFAAFRGENIIIPKNGFADRAKAGSFNFARFGDVMQMLSPALSKHGFSIRHNEVFGSKPWVTDGVESTVPWVYVTCYLEHRDGHSERLDLEGPPGDATANTPAQNMQLTGSYLKRQATLAITGTATADEDDENKLKGEGKAGAQQPDADALEALLATGRDESLKGMAALTAWWGSLNARQRADLSPDFPGLRKAAQAADQQGGAK